uniref:hypothetical protein n=1 Tax=Cupriavidus taiwanensis TaxID=164546 RepID=UPI003F4916FB
MSTPNIAVPEHVGFHVAVKSSASARRATVLADVLSRRPKAVDALNERWNRGDWMPERTEHLCTCGQDNFHAG